MSHTPEPWTWESRGGETTLWGNEHRRVMTIRDGVLPMNDDARLISAAPDLLTTAINHLEQLIEYAQYGPSDCGEICDCNRDKKGRCWFWDTWELKKAIETAAGKEVFDA